MAKRWYVVHAYSGYEKKVASALKERIQLFNMQDLFGDVLVPTEEVPKHADIEMAGQEGLEPPTFGFGDRRSTN